MEFSRKEYPALLESLQPGQAVTVLNDRIRHVGRLNGEIADWLQERRRIEEQYVQGLRKLAHRRPPDEGSELGVFSTPWQKIVASAEAIAESHHVLAQKIEADIERPLREFATTNREVQAMANIQGNLTAMAKEIDTAQKKAERLKDRGPKAPADKVGAAIMEVENATTTWESQAPFIFEKLQAVDETRLNHLRDVLTQFQTHEVDQVERNRVTAEETLNALLNVETADEISTWAVKISSDPPKAERQKSRSGPAVTLTPPVAVPSINTDDESSQRSNSIQEKDTPKEKHGGLHGLKRLGTVLGRRRQSAHPYGRASSPERKSSSNLGSAFHGFRGKSKESKENRPTSSPRKSGGASSPHGSRPSDSASIKRETTRTSTDMTNGPIPESAAEDEPSSELTNGTKPPTLSLPLLQEPLQPIVASPLSTTPEPPKDTEGFSVPPSAMDAITEAEQEASAVSETPTPQFKVDIRNAPIEEEDDGDAETALANVANTLRAQAAPTRRSGTLRGRRDVRNTIFVPSPPAGESGTFVSALNAAFQTPSTDPAGPITSSVPVNFQATTPVQSPSPSPAPQSSPFKPSTTRPTLLGEDHPASDTQSIRSGRSLASSASATVRHPEMHEAGLNSSVVEVVSAWYRDNQVTKAMVIGQVALAFNPEDLSAPFGTETIRLENFQVLEKVAPNPAFLELIPDKAGTYTVDLAKITKTSVAFHYQVHLDNENIAAYSPLQLAPAWKSEPTQTSVLLSYSLNPAFVLGPGSSSVTLSNVVLIIHLQPGVKTTHCQSKPVGTYSREKSLIYWKLGDITLSQNQPPEQLRARFFTESEAKPGNIEARWEIVGSQVSGLGSGISVSQMVPGPATEAAAEASDPFADEDTTALSAESAPPSATVNWKDVQSIRRIASGTYVVMSN